MSEQLLAIRYTADVVCLSGGYVLLIQRDWPPFESSWALPGGHVDPGETSRIAAVRELLEETGVAVEPEDIGHLGVWDAPERDPRGRYVTAAYTTIVPAGTETTAGDDARAARWWPLNALPALAFDHDAIITAAVVDHYCAGDPELADFHTRQPCGEGHCHCYGVGSEHDMCVCGCDCPRDNDGQLIDD